MFDYQDTLHRLNDPQPLTDKLIYVHDVLNQRFAFIDRIAIALFEEKSSALKTFIDSSRGEVPLRHYEAKLDDVPLLKELVEQGRPRVINDLRLMSGSGKRHTQQIVEHGYAASYTMPMYVNGALFGFIFFNSHARDVFSREVLHYLDLFGHLISLTVTSDLTNIRTLLAAVKTARDMTHRRDQETGNHLERMSHYSRLIALELARGHDLSDNFIENLFHFAPLHDIGKIAIPDKILLKPDKLTEEEFDEMKSHAIKGREIIDTMLSEFGLDTLDHIEVLRNIATYHHEALNGSGYPHGLCDDEIPLEAKIIAVADVFDALTSHRPYKEVWDNERAFAMLKTLAGSKLDPECVEALITHRYAVEEIQDRFRESIYI